MSKLLLILIILLPSCSITTKDSSEGILLGQWMVINLGGARCNVCATMEFFKEEKGSIINPSKEIVEFKYHFDKNKKNLSFKGTEKIFGEDSIFHFRLYEDKELQYLELKSIYGNGGWYILSREIKGE
jgi:hypothetical protein